jgi:HAE1 family hydrophobic/amphiphilic exporter-1
MFLLAAVLLGVVAFPRLEVGLLPDLRATQVVVWVPWSDAGVPEIEEGVARPVEEALLGAPGVRRVRSRIVPGGASFTVELQPEADADFAALGIRERLDAVRWTFPEGVERPLLLGGVGEDTPVMVLALARDDLAAAADWAETVLSPRLEQVDGVARALVTGAPEPEIRVTPRADRLAASGIGVAELAGAIRASNVDSPGGAVRRHGIRYALSVESRLETAEDVAAVTVIEPGGPVIRVGDVCDVVEGPRDPTGWSRLDGAPAVGILLYREAGANLLRVADRVHDELARLAEEHPNLAIAVIADSSPFVRQSITGIWQAVWVGGLLAFGILFAFLRDARSPLFLIAALPLSVVATFALLDALGVSLNLMSLGGIALGIGMLVDNSIVCLENIHRLRAAGLAPRDAAMRGAREISLPVLASTLTTCAVFVPLAWVPGTVGALFRDQAIAVSVSLAMSLAVALTLLPMMCALVPPPVVRERRPLFGTYHRVLEACVARPGRFLGGVAVVLVVSVMALAALPRELLPEVRTDHLTVSLRLPEGSDVTATDGAVRRVEDWLRSRGEVESTFATVGAAGSVDPSEETRRLNRATLRLVLSDSGVHERSELVGDLKRAFAGEERWELEVVTEMPGLAGLLRGSAATLTCDVTGPDDERARELAEALAASASSALPAGSVPLRVVAAEREPRLRFTPRDEALWRYGVSETDALAAIEAATSGYEVARLRRFDEELPVVIRAGAGGSPRDAAVVVAGRAFPVEELFDVAVDLAPASVLREEQARVASVRWDGPLRDVGPTLAALESAIDEVGIPSAYRVAFGGAHREMQATLMGVLRAFALSAGLVLLILAGQFESLRLPVVIFAAVPLALVGVAVVLVASGGSVNVLSGIGIVVLVGIVVNDSILKVDLLRRLRAEGMDRHSAILAAGARRYRPILMTTFTTALALTPLFFGRGAELRAPMAATLIGGLLSSTLLTLLVVPVLFDRVAGKRT